VNQLWLDDRRALAYIPCTGDLLANIERGVLPA
jgi:hypothetical protein